MGNSKIIKAILNQSFYQTGLVFMNKKLIDWLTIKWVVSVQISFVILLMLCFFGTVSGERAFVVNQTVYLPFVVSRSGEIVVPTPTLTPSPTSTPAPTSTPHPDGWNGHNNPAFALNNNPDNPTSNSRWVYCGEEGEVCSVSQSYLIAYGELMWVVDESDDVEYSHVIFNYVWTEQPDTSTIPCNDETFGNPFDTSSIAEPELKACWLYAPDDGVDIAPPPQDEGNEWEYCAFDKESCRFPEQGDTPMQVAYGTSDDHVIRTYTDIELVVAAQEYKEETGGSGATCQHGLFDNPNSKGLCWIRLP